MEVAKLRAARLDEDVAVVEIVVDKRIGRAEGD